jgi:hypothetical protein
VLATKPSEANFGPAAAQAPVTSPEAMAPQAPVTNP